MKKFTKQEIIELFGQVVMGEISFSRMVEMLNEKVNEIDEPQYKDGDFLHSDWGDENITIIYREKNGGDFYYHVSKSKTIGLGFDRYGYWPNDIDFRLATESEKKELIDALTGVGKRWNAEKLCVEDIPAELKKGDLVIFWDSNKEEAFIGIYKQFLMGVIFQHKDHRGNLWKNAVKYESKEQYRKLLKGEI